MTPPLEQRFVRAVGKLVPTERRREWVAEWTAELSHQRRALADRGSLTWRDRAALLARAAGSAVDAITVRRLHTVVSHRPIHLPERVMNMLRQDVRFAVRVLARKPLFTAMAVATLALGIGAATTIFTILDGVLLKPLGFPDSHQLVTVWQTDSDYQQQTTLSRRWNRLWFTYPEYLAWRRAQQSFSDVAVFGSQEMALTEPGEPAEVAVFTATPTLMPLLGVRPVLGRWFLPEEQGTGTARLAVLSHGTWMTTFGGDPSVIDRSITLDDQRYRIIGVMPREFRLPNLTSSATAPPALWIPLGADGGGGDFDSSYEGIGRLRPGVSLEAAMAETGGLIGALTGRANRGANLVPRLEAETSRARAPLLLLAAGVGLLLTITCVNMAMLLLGEVPAREHEFATRAALGASSRQMIRQLLTESTVLAVFAGLVGTGLALAGVRLLLLWAPESMPRLEGVGVDLRALLFAAGLTALTGLGFGLAPALSASHGRVGESLRVAARQIGRQRRRLQHVAVAAQVAMALVLLTGAGVLGRSLWELQRIDPGFVPDPVLTLSITPSVLRYPEPAALRDFHDRLEAAVLALPGVEQVGAISNLPFTGRNGTMSIDIEGVATAPGTPRPNVQRRSVRPGYFGAMGIPFRSGRTFAVSDPADAIIIDETMARRFWPSESAIGRRIRAYGQVQTVIGVVGAVHHARLGDSEQPTVYFPYSRMATREMSLVIGTGAADPATLAEPVRQVIRSLDPTIPLPDIATMTARITRSTSTEAYRTILLGCFGLAATLLTVLGIFGVTARTVNQQRQEIGVRIALGASRWTIMRQVLRHQLLSLVAGISIGATVVWMISPLLARFVFRIGPFDPVTLLAAVALLGGAGVAGAGLPASAASRFDPARLIRSD